MSLINTLMQPLIAQTGNFDNNEIRPSLYGVTRAFMDSNDSPNAAFSQDLKDKLVISSGNTVKVSRLNDRTFTIGSDLECTVPLSDGTSGFYVFTKQAFSFSFTMFPAQHGQNYETYERLRTANLAGGLRDIMAAIESAGVAFLELNKNQYWANIDPDFYSQTANDLQVPQASKNDFYNQLNAIFMRMDFARAPIKIVSNVNHVPTVNYIAAQGQANAQNLAFQLPPYSWGYSNFIPNDIDIQSTLYAYEDGSLGIGFTHHPDALINSQTGNGHKWYTGDIPIPGLGRSMPFSLKYFSDCGDAAAVTGRTDLGATHIEQFQFLTQVTFGFKYNSDPANKYNPLIKAEISLL